MKVLRRGWRLQIAKLCREWFVNKVGACGMASAELYWGRCVFVDDFLWLLKVRESGYLELGAPPVGHAAAGGPQVLMQK